MDFMFQLQSRGSKGHEAEVHSQVRIEIMYLLSSILRLWTIIKRFILSIEVRGMRKDYKLPLRVSTGCRCETWEVVTSRVEEGAERTEKAARETADSLGSGQWHCTVYFAMGRIIHCSDLILRINDSQVGTFLNEVDLSSVHQ